MSLAIPVYNVCKVCGNSFEAMAHGMLNHALETDRKLLQNDNFNMVVCPHCGERSRLPMSVLSQSARVWYKPTTQTDVFYDDITVVLEQGESFKDLKVVKTWNQFVKKISEVHIDPKAVEPKKAELIAYQAMTDKMFMGMLNMSKSLMGVKQDQMYLLEDGACKYAITPKKPIGLIIWLMGFQMCELL